MGFSHRDLRAERVVREGFWAVAALVAAVSTLAFVAPTALVGGVTLIGLAAIGGAYLVGAERFLGEYHRDLRAARGPEVPGWLRVEAGREVPAERPVGLPSQRSPHVRPPPPGPERGPRSSKHR
jgi:hypothetical protein